MKPFLLLTLFLTVSLHSAPDTQWMLHKTEDGSHPDGNEQQMTWLMNRARSNPAEEGKWLAGDVLSLPSDVTQEYAARNISDQLIKNEFKTLTPQKPAAFDRRLYEASKAHSEFLSTSPVQTHDGQILLFFRQIGGNVFNLIGGMGGGLFRFKWRIYTY